MLDPKEALQMPCASKHRNVIFSHAVVLDRASKYWWRLQMFECLAVVRSCYGWCVSFWSNNPNHCRRRRMFHAILTWYRLIQNAWQQANWLSFETCLESAWSHTSMLVGPNVCTHPTAMIRAVMIVLGRDSYLQHNTLTGTSASHQLFRCLPVYMIWPMFQLGTLEYYELVSKRAVLLWSPYPLLYLCIKSHSLLVFLHCVYGVCELFFLADIAFRSLPHILLCIFVYRQQYLIGSKYPRNICFYNIFIGVCSMQAGSVGAFAAGSEFAFGTIVQVCPWELLPQLVSS